VIRDDGNRQSGGDAPRAVKGRHIRQRAVVRQINRVPPAGRDHDARVRVLRAGALLVPDRHVGALPRVDILDRESRVVGECGAGVVDIFEQLWEYGLGGGRGCADITFCFEIIAERTDRAVIFADDETERFVRLEHGGAVESGGESDLARLVDRDTAIRIDGVRGRQHRRAAGVEIRDARIHRGGGIQVLRGELGVECAGLRVRDGDDGRRTAEPRKQKERGDECD